MYKNIKEFIYNELLTKKKNSINAKKINIIWYGFDDYYKCYINSSNRIKYIYDLYYDIESDPLCDCGSVLNFSNFKQGYTTCSKGLKCLILRKKRSDMLLKTGCNLEWFENKFSKKIVKDNIEEFKLLSDYLSYKKIRMNKNLNILKWIENYIKYGIKYWVIRVDKTIKSISDEIINSKDSISKKSLKIRYGSLYRKIYKKRCESCSRNKKYFITKYGNIEGEKRWNNFYNKIVTNFRKANKNRYSKESVDFCHDIITLLEKNDITYGDVMYGENECFILNEELFYRYFI